MRVLLLSIRCLIRFGTQRVRPMFVTFLGYLADAGVEEWMALPLDAVTHRRRLVT